MPHQRIVGYEQPVARFPLCSLDAESTSQSLQHYFELCQKDPRRLRSPSFRMVFTCDSCHLIQYMQTKYVQKGTSEVLISPVDLNSALSETWRCRLPVQARAKQEDADAGTVLICGRTICRLDSKRAARPCRRAHPVDLDRMACLRKCLRAGRWWSAFHLCGGRGLESRRGRMRFFR